MSSQDQARNPRSPQKRSASDAVDFFLKRLNEEAYAGNASPTSSRLREVRMGDAEEYEGIRDYLLVEVGDRLAAVGSRMNSKVPVQSLPVEILLKIFAIYIFQRPPPRRAVSSPCSLLNLLATVCRSWASIVNGDPHFWTFITPMDPIGAVERALVRSNTAPLAITWNTEHSAKPRADPKAFWAAATAHQSRWETLKVKVMKAKDIKYLLESGALAKKGANALKKLELEIVLGRHPAVVDLLGGDAPNLECITLSSVAPRDWSSPIFYGLRSLSLTNITVQGAPSLSHLMDILRQSPELSSLELARLDIPSPEQRPPPEIIHLDNLQTLAIAYLPPTVTTHILASVRTPQCHHYQCSVHPDQQGEEILLWEYAARVAPSLDHLIKTCTELSIILTIDRDDSDEVPYDIVHVEVWPTDPRVWEEKQCSCRIVGVPSQDVMAWLLGGPFRVVPSTTRVRISLSRDLAASHFSPSPILHHLPIAEIYMERLDSVTANAMIFSLQRPFEVDGSLRWPCPVLREMEFEGCTGVDSSLLASMVEARTWNISINGRVTQGESPVPMELLAVESAWVDLQTYGRLKRVLGDAVQWDGDAETELETEE